MNRPSLRAGLCAAALVTASLAAAGEYGYRLQAANQLVSQGKYDAAITAFQDLVRTKPDAWEGHNGLAIAYSAVNRLPDAIAEGTKAIELSPKRAVLYENRGRYAESLGRPDDALADFNRALALEDLQVSRFHRATIEYDRGQYPAALDDINKVIRMKPPAPPIVWGWRGDVYFAMGKYPEAVADYERYLPTVQYDVREGRAGFAYVKLGQPDRARTMASRLIDVDPRLDAFFGGDHALDLFDFDARRAATAESVAAAKDAETKGQWDRAFREWMRAYGHMLGYTKDDQAQAGGVEQGILRSYLKLAAKPEIPEAARRFKIQAAAAVREKNYAQAEDLFRKANRVAPWDGESCFNRALVLAELNRKPEAIHDMKIYLLLDPHAPDARAAQDKIYEWGG